MYEKIKNLKRSKFKRHTGVYPETFDRMIEVVKEKTAKKHILGGKPSQIAIEDQVLMMLRYYRRYDTFEEVGFDFGVSESCAYKIITKVEKMLIESKEFHLPGKKKLLEPDFDIEYVIVDVTESPVERPQDGQKEYYSGKKKDIQ